MERVWDDPLGLNGKYVRVYGKKKKKKKINALINMQNSCHIFVRESFIVNFHEI